MNQVTLNSSELFMEGIRVISRPLDADMGVRPLTPFVVSLSAETSNYEELSVDLYANNSKSIPYTSELDNNWSKLKPQWRFTDVDGNYIEDSMPIVFDSEVVDEDGNVRGGIGTATFYYIDDLPSDGGVPVMLQVVLNTLNYYDRKYRGAENPIKSFYNSKMKTIIPFNIYPIKPSFIHFSQNGALDLTSPQWAGNAIASYATIHGIPRTKFLDYTDCAIDYPIIFNAPKYDSVSGTNILDYSIYPLLSSEISTSGSPVAEFLSFELSSGVANGGWVELETTSLVETSGAMLTGNVDVTYDLEDYECTGTSSMWVSNSTANMIHKIETIYMDVSNPALSGFYEVEGDYINNNVFSTGFNVPFYEEGYYDPNANAGILSNIWELSGYSGVYGMAIDGDDNVWNLDFELDRIYKRDSAGSIIFTIDLQNTTSMPAPYADDEYSWYGPSSISLNQVGDAYVSLYNSPSAMKISSSGTIGAFFAPSGASLTPPPASGDEGTYYRPIDIEVGIGGDVHVLYSNDKKSAIVRFDSDGNEIGTAWNVTTEFRPVDMTYLEDGGTENLYVTITGKYPSGIPYRGIKRFQILPTSYSTTVNNICLASDPTFISVDGNKNIWFAFDHNKIGVLTDITTTGQGEISNYFELPTGLEVDIIGGLACDSSGFVNILDAYSNIIYRQNADGFIQSGTSSLYAVNINPKEQYTIIKEDGIIQTIQALSGEEVPSLQAYGDWSGLSWNLKFADESAVSGSETVTLSGSSAPFKIKAFQEDFNLRRQNDSWDMHQQILSYVIPDFQKGFTDLWDDLIGNTVGNDSSGYQTFGRQFYEKIANFVLNHSDIDLSNVSQLYSNFESMDKSYDNYDFNYPADLGHWMNILSIMFERLKGSQIQCNRNFKPQRYEDYEECEVCGEIHTSNMGERIPVNPNLISDLDGYGVTIVSGPISLSSTTLAPVKETVASNNVTYTVPMYSTNSIISGTKYPIVETLLDIPSPISSNGHVRIVIAGETYFVPLYSPDAPVPMPADHTLYFNYDIVDINGEDLIAAGYIPFSYLNQTLMMPVYQYTSLTPVSATVIIEPYAEVMVEGTPVIIRDTFMSSKAFDIFYPPFTGNYQTLSDLYGFRSPFATNYEVYTYIPTVSVNAQSEGFINWSDSHNQIPISGVSSNEWWETGGYVEQIFTQILYGNLGYSVEVITAGQAQNIFNVNIISNLTADESIIITSGVMTSEYLIPVKGSECSPMAGYGLPFYSSSGIVSGGIPLGYPFDGVVDGLAVSERYVKIVIGDEIFYAPTYIIDPIPLPIYGTGLYFSGGVVVPDHSLVSYGFLVFSNDGDSILLPIYK